MEWIEIIVAITLFFLAFYYWSTSTFDFWESRGILGPSPYPLIGNFKEVMFGKTSIGEFFEKIYNDFHNESVVGAFINREPALVLIDPELIKDVLIKDFAIFADRGFGTFDKVEPLSQHLANLEPARWRPLRNKLSPTFSSGKLKNMFHLVIECGQHLEEYLGKLIIDDEIVECRELTSKFATDVIGSCVFGLQMNALTDENSAFRKMGREIFTRNWKIMMILRIRESAPRLYSLLGPLIVDMRLTKFFTNLTIDVMDHRKNNNIVKHDFIGLIMALKDHPDKAGDIELSDTFLAAQLFVFFAAGLETTSTAMSNTLYELAQHQSIQDRVRKEINDEITKNNGEFTYDVIKSMKYLDMVFKEALRKYPPASALLRKPSEDYTFAGTKLTIPKGTKVVIPVLGIHRDPRIYPKPEVFDPERFTEEAIQARHPMNELTFGDGPRNCIAARFATYQSKVGLIKILHHYKVEVCDKTQIPYVMEPQSAILVAKGGVHVKISKVE